MYSSKDKFHGTEPSSTERQSAFLRKFYRSVIKNQLLILKPTIKFLSKFEISSMKLSVQIAHHFYFFLTFTQQESLNNKFLYFFLYLFSR